VLTGTLERTDRFQHAYFSFQVVELKQMCQAKRADVVVMDTNSLTPAQGQKLAKMLGVRVSHQHERFVLSPLRNSILRRGPVTGDGQVSSHLGDLCSESTLRGESIAGPLLLSSY
jgi:hypothetical protein